jgi:hypothetical protein
MKGKLHKDPAARLCKNVISFFSYRVKYMKNNCKTLMHRKEYKAGVNYEL